jgi:hypothetical protein
MPTTFYEKSYVLENGTIRTIGPITAAEHAEMLASGAREIGRGGFGPSIGYRTNFDRAAPDALTTLQAPDATVTPLLPPTMNFDVDPDNGPTTALARNTPGGRTPQQNAAAQTLAADAPLPLPVMQF